MAGFVLCQDLTTGAGNLPIPGDQDTIEEWCGDWSQRWRVTDPATPEPAGSDGYYMTLDSQCNNTGGRLKADKIAGMGFGYAFLEKRQTINLTGKQWFARIDPAMADSFVSFGAFFWFFDINRTDGFAEAVIRQAGATPDVFGVINPYDPDVHQWVRFWHDEAADEVGIDVAAFCGSWTNIATGTASLLPRAISNAQLYVSFEAYEPPTAYLAVGTINVADYP